MHQWLPKKDSLKRPAFLFLANSIEKAIQSGKIEPGDRLPPQREMATTLDVSLQTVSRAYQELHKRNLVQGEVGRGTYIRAIHPEKRMPFGTMRMAENIAELSIFKPVVSEIHEVALKETLTSLGNNIPHDIYRSFRPNEGLTRHRQVATDWLKICGYQAEQHQVMITNGVTQGTNAALLSVCRAGDTILSESITSHSLMALCSFIGLKIQGVEIDKYGILPEPFEQACQQGNISALYLIPSLANPYTYLMPEERRREIVQIARKYNIFIIENDVLGPLVANKPPTLSSLAPERSFYLTSFTKILIPGMRTGYLVVPPGMIREVRNRLLATVWMATPLTAEIISRLINAGTARKLLLWQRRALQERYKITHQILSNIEFHSHPNALHIWLPLPGRWRPSNFVDQAMEQGVAIAPSDPFQVSYNNDIKAIRVSLGACGMDDLKRGLRVIKQLLENENEFTVFSL